MQTADLTRTLVLTRNGRVVASQHEREGVERSLEGQVTFTDSRGNAPAIVRLSSSTWLRVNSFSINPGHGKAIAYALSTTEDQ